MTTDFNSSEEIFSALIGGLKLTNNSLDRNEYFMLGSEKPHLHLVNNVGKEFPIGILSHTPIKDWKIWSEPVEAKFKVGDFVYEKYAKRLCYVLEVSRYERKIAQFVYMVFDGARDVCLPEERLVSFDLIKKSIMR